MTLPSNFYYFHLSYCQFSCLNQFSQIKSTKMYVLWNGFKLFIVKRRKHCTGLRMHSWFIFLLWLHLIKFFLFPPLLSSPSMLFILCFFSTGQHMWLHPNSTQSQQAPQASTQAPALLNMVLTVRGSTWGLNWATHTHKDLAVIYLQRSCDWSENLQTYSVRESNNYKSKKNGGTKIRNTKHWTA